MTELQQRLLKMLNWFHVFCVEHDLRYYALGGTLLGAVRHKGFIPWDDDIDVGMPRKDYDRFICCIIEENNQSDFVLETPLSNKDYVYQYCKLYDKNTTLIEKTRYKTRRGIFLDIFPLDGIGNTYKESVKNFKSINKRNNYIMTKVCAFSSHRKLYKNLSIFVSRCIPLPTWRNVLKRLDNRCRLKRFDSFNYIANCYGNWREKEIWERDWFGTPQKVLFDGIEICIPENADAVLRTTYGDYMQFPPIEKQVTHHDYLYLDLKKSYLD